MLFIQALEAYQEAAKRNPDSKEVANKVKSLSRLVRNASAKNGQNHARSNGAVSSLKEYDLAKNKLVGIRNQQRLLCGIPSPPISTGRNC